MKQATFRVIRFDVTGTYTALAWNYDQAVLLGTRDFPTYTEARVELDKLCEAAGVELKWFDGAYHCPRGSDQILPLDVA